MKKIFKILICAIVGVAVVFGCGLLFLTRGMNELENANINQIDILQIDDGKYLGNYNNGRWTNQIEVVVKHNQITNIQIVKDVLFKNEKVFEELVNRVVENQNNKVDTVSGATVTCNAYLKSIENALSN